MPVHPRRTVSLMKCLDSFEGIATNGMKIRIILSQLMTCKVLIYKQIAERATGRQIYLIRD
jgi:hypothetical protein